MTLRPSAFVTACRNVARCLVKVTAGGRDPGRSVVGRVAADGG